jgi:hypothetical protein
MVSNLDKDEQEVPLEVFVCFVVDVCVGLSVLVLVDI